MRKILLLLSVAFLLSISAEAYAQVSYFQGWDDAGAGIAGWTNAGTGGSFLRTITLPCTGAGSARANIYQAGDVTEFISPLLGTSNGGLTTLTFYYKVVDYWSTPYDPAACEDFTIGVEWATSTAGPWNSLGLIDCGNHVFSASCAQGPGTYQFTPTANDEVYLRFVVTRLAGDNYYYFDDVNVEEELPPCTGTPDPGNTIASTNPLCSGVDFTLSVQNATPGSGVTYQWQSSPDGSNPWTDMGTSSTQITSQTAATYYRCQVSCTPSSETGTSTPLYVTMESFSNCYCDSCATYSDDTKIDNVTLNTLI